MEVLFWFGMGALATMVGAAVVVVGLALWHSVRRRAAVSAAIASAFAASTRACRGCGCTEITACLMPDGAPCWWDEPDQCSACAWGEPALAALDADDG